MGCPNFCATPMARSGVDPTGYCWLLLNSFISPKAISMGILEKIPTFLTVGVLVIIFVCLKRQARSPRLTLWTVGCALVFTHFLAQLLEPDHGHVSSLLLAIDSAALQAAAVSFLVSASSVVEDYVKRSLLLLVLGVPSVAYVAFERCDVQARWPYILCLIACFGGAVCFFFRVNRNCPCTWLPQPSYAPSPECGRFERHSTGRLRKERSRCLDLDLVCLDCLSAGTVAESLLPC